jgi:hypothetical protein
MTQHVLDSNVFNDQPWWYRWSREGRLIKQFFKLKDEGVRSTPAVTLKNDDLATEVVAPPKRPGGHWKLYDGRTVTTDEIAHLDTARFLAGYSY